jgi:hypothetical protein
VHRAGHETAHEKRKCALEFRRDMDIVRGGEKEVTNAG